MATTKMATTHMVTTPHSSRSGSSRPTQRTYRHGPCRRNGAEPIGARGPPRRKSHSDGFPLASPWSAPTASVWPQRSSTQDCCLSDSKDELVVGSPRTRRLSLRTSQSPSVPCRYCPVSRLPVPSSCSFSVRSRRYNSPPEELASPCQVGTTGPSLCAQLGAVGPTFAVAGPEIGFERSTGHNTGMTNTDQRDPIDGNRAPAPTRRKAPRYRARRSVR